MRPLFQIMADGVDITMLLIGRLTRLTINDRSGEKADTAEIEIDDRGYLVALPTKGAKLQIALGFLETGLVNMGEFAVDRISGSGPRSTLSIRAQAADMTSAMRAPRNRAFKKKTLEDIVGEIAGEYGLKPAVDEELAATAYDYIAQTAESDIHFLTRLARPLDAIAKPAAGHLVFVKRGSGKAADGSEIPPVPLMVSDMADWSWEITGRRRYKKASARWRDLASATLKTETHGDGDPAIEIRHVYPIQAEAKRAAKAKVEGAGRASGKFTGNCAGFYPGLVAGGTVVLLDVKPELCGPWTIESVTHRLGGPLQTSFTAERDNEEEAS